MRSMVAAGLALVFSAAAVACSPPDMASHAESGPPVTEEELARLAVLEPGALAMVPTAPVTGFSGPGGRPFEVTVRTQETSAALFRPFGSRTLQTSLRDRAPDVGQYPCTSCHLGRAMVLEDRRVGDAHQNIRESHPEHTGGACSTCHAPDNVELLALRSGERATLDHTYRLCAQCHFPQAQAWAAGAHGKRLDGWQGRRVVMGCADCHDPHQPALEKRIPFPGPQLTRNPDPHR
jgi:hypothetical protein